MDFQGWTLEMPKWPKMGLLFTRKRNTEVERPSDRILSKLKKDQLTIDFEYILRIFSGTRNNVSLLCITIVALGPDGKADPETLHFTPISYDVAKLAEVLNMYVFNAPAPPPVRFKVYINPNAGSKEGEKIFRKRVEPFLMAAGCVVSRTDNPDHGNYTHVVSTTGPGFARDDAARIRIASFDTIMCIGGDGLIHEVINGLANHAEATLALRRLAIAVIPAGSGNAMSNSLFGDCDPGYATWQAISNFRMKVDLMSLTPIAKDRPTLWLFLSVAMGWIAKADIGTERLRRLGDARFGMGVAWQLMLVNKYECSLAKHGALEPTVDANANAKARQNAIKTQIRNFYNEQYNRRQRNDSRSELPRNGPLDAIVDSHLPMDKWEHVAEKKMNNFYAGKLPWVSKGTCIFPAALPNDGYIDLCILKGTNWNSGRKAMTAAGPGSHFGLDEVDYFKVKAFKLVPGVRYEGEDNDNLNKAAAPITDADGAHHIPRRANVEKKSFRNKFYLSVDGERYDPGHGVVCEVHQGLATFVCDSHREKYLPTSIYHGGISQTAAIHRRELDEADLDKEGTVTPADWLKAGEEKVNNWKLQYSGDSLTTKCG